MKTVRLPMYGEDGIELPGYLEVDLEFFISSTRGLRSNQARVVQPEEPMAEWEKELCFEVVKEELDTVDRIISGLPPTEEWRDLPRKELSSFEINHAGIVRHKKTKREVEPTFDYDLDQLNMKVYLNINGVKNWVDGPKLADRMWGIDV